VTEETPEIDPAQIAEDYEQQQFEEWLQRGLDAKWIAMPDCATHNATPLRAWEEHQFEEGYDPCIIVARLWRDGYQHVTLDEVKAENGE
jgi:hypothetical protein